MGELNFAEGPFLHCSIPVLIYQQQVLMLRLGSTTRPSMPCKLVQLDIKIKLPSRTGACDAACSQGDLNGKHGMQPSV